MQSHDHAVFLVFTSRGRPCFVGKTRGDPATVFGPNGRAPIIAVVRDRLSAAAAQQTVDAFVSAIGLENLGAGSLQGQEPEFAYA